MNAFERLVNLSDSERAEKGLMHTPSEIRHQPEMWRQALGLLDGRREEIRSFLETSGLLGPGKATAVLTGAGSSEFVGSAVCPLWRGEFRREVISIPTTDLVTHGESLLNPDEPYLLVSFGRSGNSPESVATYNLVKRHCPEARHLVITCNKEGALARQASQDESALSIVLPEGTHDQSLVMTSSYSTMVWAAAALAYLDREDELKRLLDRLTAGAQRIFGEYGDLLWEFAARKFSRACYLGSDALFGVGRECQLKMLEMTEGRVATRSESFLGLRHGPQVFVNTECVVIASLAAQEKVRRYELDLLRELKGKQQGQAVLVICDRANEEIEGAADYILELFPEGEAVPDPLRILTDVIVGQILATFKSIDVGLQPDNPSSSGLINRVVQGVVIYE